jgi:hypothetical protein
MLKVLRNILAAAAVSLGFALPASATTTLGTDFTDLWWGGAAENGWGLNVIHQNNIIFATLYVYNADSSPRFFSGSETRATSTNSFSGPLYDTHGTYYGTVPYNAAAFGGTQVGTITLTFSSANAGTLQYNVGGVTVTKSIQRFAFGGNNLSGNYLGGLTATSTCGGASQLTLVFDTLTVTHTGSSVTMRVQFFNATGIGSTCTYTGGYSQQGSLGTIQGSYNCTIGTTTLQGSFTLSEISPHQSGFSGRFVGSDNACTSHSGWFGGTRDVI